MLWRLDSSEIKLIYSQTLKVQIKNTNVVWVPIYLEFCFLQGTTAEQDNRFSDKEKKLLKQMKFDNNLQKPVSSLLLKHSITN